MSQSNEDTGRDGGGGGGGGDGVRIDINSSAVGAPTADADEDGVVTLPDDVPDRLKSYKKIKAADSKTMSRLQRALKLEHIARCDVYTGLGVSTPWGRLFGGEILAQVLLEYVRKYVMFGAALASMCRCVLRTYFLHSRHGACPCVVTKTLHSTTTRTHAMRDRGRTSKTTAIHHRGVARKLPVAVLSDANTHLINNGRWCRPAAM